MKHISKLAKKLWKDESAQGATEYILLLVIVVAIVLMFRGRIQELLQGRIDALSGGLGEVGTSF